MRIGSARGQCIALGLARQEMTAAISPNDRLDPDVEEVLLEVGILA